MSKSVEPAVFFTLLCDRIPFLLYTDRSVKGHDSFIPTALVLGDTSASSEDGAHLRCIFWRNATEGYKEICQKPPHEAPSSGYVCGGAGQSQQADKQTRKRVKK